MLTSFQNSFSSGELSPSVWARTDLQKWKSGAATMRNFFANYRGGASSRAGTAYVGMCKQGAPNAGGTSTSNPPRDIPYQFSLEQGYALEFGDLYMRVKSGGAYVTETPKNLTGITQANPAVFTVAAHGYNNGDWVFPIGITGPTALNGLTYIVQNKTTNTFTLTDLFGNPINTNPLPVYTGGGTFARIYTLVTPYAAIDLPFLKFTQSATTMSLGCVNQVTGTEYPTYDLAYVSPSNWTLTQVNFASSIAAPSGLAATANSSTTLNTWYGYVVTAVAADGEESIASTPAYVHNNDISINAGSNVLTWSPITGAVSYNVYAATPVYSTSATSQVPAGVLYGFVGRSLSTNFVDTNIVADFTITPPMHNNPFARGAIIGLTPTAGGTGYTQATVGYIITTATGSGAVLLPIVASGAVVAFIVLNGGKGYLPADTITLTDSGGGSGATATLIIGAQTGTYPAGVAYFQQRRSYFFTLNNPNTYYMSQPGAFLNMDSSLPTTDASAIVGAPWAQQINGIQFMVPMPGGLVIFTGAGVWQLTGGSSAALTAADETATPQAYNGCHNHVQPIAINYNILFLQSKGSIVRDLQYNFFVNIYTSTDQTVLANHLFTNHQIIQWSYAEEPYKIIWAIRDDGILLSFTYLKEQDVYAWARHDTNGLFQSVVSVVEPPANTTNVYVDAVYLIVKRYINGQWVYYSERMDNRLWSNVEQTWCVDAALSLPMIYPNATLTPASAIGPGSISGTNLVWGGHGYTNPTAEAFDATGKGTGATFNVTQVGGVITAVTPTSGGTLYQPGTQIFINDPTGSGVSVYPVINNNVTFTASSSVFTPAMVGDILRVGGGKAVITSYVSGAQVVANITQSITSVVQNDPNNTPIPQGSGEWTIGTPVTTVGGLNHLAGLQVSILADGSVLPQQTVSASGSINLPAPYSQVLVGLPFTAQLQTLYLDVPDHGGGTTQGKRKDIFGVTVRMENSRGMSIGTNQPDASTQPNGVNVPWGQPPYTSLFPFKERNADIQMGSAIPLFTGDEYIPVSADWSEKGQIAVQQTNPLPANVLGCTFWYQMGDTSG